MSQGGRTDGGLKKKKMKKNVDPWARRWSDKRGDEWWHWAISQAGR